MVGTRNHQDSVVPLQSVDFIEEVGPGVLVYNCVNILEDEEAWSHLSSNNEYISQLICANRCFDV